MKAIEKLTKAISAAEEELDEIERVIDSLTVETQAATSRITADLLSGEIDDAKAAKLREQAERELERMQDRRETLRSALPELRARLAAEQEVGRLVTVEKSRDELRRALANRERALRQFAARTREANAAAAEVGRHRKLIDARLATLRPLLRDDEELGLDLARAVH